MPPPAALHASNAITEQTPLFSFSCASSLMGQTAPRESRNAAKLALAGSSSIASGWLAYPIPAPPYHHPVSRLPCLNGINIHTGGIQSLRVAFIQCSLAAFVQCRLTLVEWQVLTKLQLQMDWSYMALIEAFCHSCTQVSGLLRLFL